MTMPKKLCVICDAMYDPKDEGKHLHAEPQSGNIRVAWLASGLCWIDFMVECEEAFLVYREIWNAHLKECGILK